MDDKCDLKSSKFVEYSSPSKVERVENADDNIKQSFFPYFNMSKNLPSYWMISGSDK